jgi:uncharacterized protein (DUF58 family)
MSIVPSNRLLLFTALMLPFTLAGILVPEAAGVSAGLMIGLTAIVLLDAVRAHGGLRGIQVILPEVIRLSRDREGLIPLFVRNPGQKSLPLRLGLPFPPGLETAEEDLHALLPQDVECSRLEWACHPLRRGGFPMKACYLETPSPFGFWNARARVSAPTEVRVYPNLAREKKQLAALFLNRGYFGVHAQRMVGQGREFEKLRDYVQGDSYEQIHWKATAKRGRPITKVFQVERTQEVYVAIDHSRLSGRQVNAETVLERFLTAALVLGLAAERQGDHFGLLAFSDRINRFVRAKNGRAHYNSCRDALYNLHPEMVNPDFEEACTFIRLRLRKRALIVFLTDLDDPVLAEHFVRNATLIARQHLVLAIRVRSERVQPLFHEAAVDSVDGIYRCLGGHLQWRYLRELTKVLQRQGVRLIQFSHEELSARLVAEYLSIKQKQAL